jgi:RNase P/RNase MRP subunit POP5
MSFRHGKNTAVLVGEYDISAYLNEVSSSMSIETADTSTFGTNAKTYITGQNDGTISTSGLFDGAADAIADIFENIIDNDLTSAITIAPDGGLVVGGKASLAAAKQTSYEISAPVSDVVSLSAEFQVTAGLRQGVLLAANTSHTTSTNVASVDGAASSALGATANLHVTANTRTDTTVIKVQHSADNSTWADLITFTTVATGTITSEIATASGTVNRYLRATTTIATGTGSITYTLSLSRRSN